MTAVVAPMTPLLASVHAHRGAGTHPSLMDLEHLRVVSRGAAALALILEAEGVGAKDEVLMPAYHCPIMVAAVKAVGADAGFFRIQENLEVSPGDVIEAATMRTKVVLLPHLFKVRQPDGLFDYLRGNSNWLVIEDCAHSFFGSLGTRAIGSSGDYAIGSIAKFFPVGWGGIIASQRRGVDVPLKKPTAAFQMKLILNAIEKAGHFGRFGPISGPVVSALRGVSWMREKGRGAKSHLSVEPGDDQRNSVAREVLDKAHLHETGGWWPERVVRQQAVFSSRVQARMGAYERLCAALDGMRNGRVLRRDDPPDFPPYVLPLLLAKPARDFAELKNRGVPMLRWEHAVRGRCPVADTYSESLVQLPCHESLSSEEIQRLSDTVRAVLV
jgi:hypothetical protein